MYYFKGVLSFSDVNSQTTTGQQQLMILIVSQQRMRLECKQDGFSIKITHAVFMKFKIQRVKKSNENKIAEKQILSHVNGFTKEDCIRR